MKNLRKYLLLIQRFKYLVLIFVLAFTFILRAHNYDRVPGIGHLEELAFGWAGINLIETGTPISWSTLDYPEESIVHKGAILLNGGEPKLFVTLYKPWLDQPPLFSLIAGGSAHLFGANRNEVLAPSHIRIPSVFIAFFVSILIFLIARKVSGFWIGVLAVLIYGTVPMFVFASRMAVPENLIALVYLAVIYLLLKFRDKPSFWLILPIPFLIGIAGLSKATGFLIAPIVIYEVFAKKLYKSIPFIVLVVSIFVGIFIWYGVHFDSKIFWRIMEIQSSRPVGFSGLGYILTTPSFDIDIFHDNFYIFCLVSFIAFLFGGKFLFKNNEKEKNFILFTALYWLLVVMFSGGERDLLSWYRYAFFPLLSIVGAWGLVYVYKNTSFVTTALTVALMLGNRFYLVNPFRPHIPPLLFRALFAGAVLPSLFYETFSTKRLELLSRIVLLVVIAVGFYINIVLVYNWTEITCENLPCLMGPSTWMSGIHLPIIWRFFVLPPLN